MAGQHLVASSSRPSRRDGRGRAGPTVLRCATAALFGIFAAPSEAARKPLPVACTPEDGEFVRVTAVTDDLELKLADGRTILLAGVDPVRATPDHPALAAEARRRIGAWLEGRGAILRPVQPLADRWGRVAALVFAATGETASSAADSPPTAAPPLLSVGLALVDAGLARGRPEPELHLCWPAVLRAEQGARTAGLGLWADPYYAVRQITEGTSLTAEIGGMALVQGRVTRIGRGRSRLYLGMGHDGWDFALRLPTRDASLLAELGLDANHLLGSVLRARGILDDRFGLGMDVTSADQIEVLSGPDRASGSDR